MWKATITNAFLSFKMCKKCVREKMVLDTIINRMTETEFWDKFNSKHNPGYQYAKKKIKKENKEKNQKQKDHTVKYKVFRKQD